MPANVYGYTRVSLAKQVEGTSIPDLTEQAHKYAQFLATTRSDLIVREVEQFMFVDAAVSSKTYFMQRPAGCALFAATKEGDIIVIPRFDRAFRSSGDFETTMDYCHMRGIILYILDAKADFNTAYGRMTLGILATVKRCEREIIAEKAKAAMEYQRAHGRPTIPRAGWKFSDQKIGKFKRVVIDHEYRKQANYILKLKDEDGLSFREIYGRLLVEREKRTTVGHMKNCRGREWSFGSIQNAYKAAKAGFPQNSKSEPSESTSEGTRGPSIATQSPQAPAASSSSLDSSAPPPA